VSGRGIPVTGNDIDTDRIIPARLLKAVTFEGMGEHAPQALMRWGVRAIVGGSFGEIVFGDRVIKATMSDGPRHQLVAGTWDSTAVLLEAGATIEATAGKLPYVAGW